MNGNGQKAPEWIPAATLVRVEAIAREFLRVRATGQVTIVLHFQQGRPMSSELVVREMGPAEAGPSDVLFAVRR